MDIAKNRLTKLLSYSMFALLLTSCAAVDAITGVTLDSPKVENMIETGVLDQSGFSVTATCPNPLSGNVGDTRTCSIEDENGTVALVDVTIQNSNGDIVWKVRD